MRDVSSFTKTHLCDVESAEVDLRKTIRKRICVYVEGAKVDLRKGIRMRICVCVCACTYVLMRALISSYINN